MILFLLLSITSEANSLSVTSGGDTIPGTTQSLKTREDTLLFMLALMDNSEQYWRKKAYMVRAANDSLTAALNRCVSAVDKTVTEVTESVRWIKEDSRAKDDAYVAELAEKDKLYKKERRRKIFWKTVAVVNGVVVVVVTVIALI
jgi:hypothetical protein